MLIVSVLSFSISISNALVLDRRQNGQGGSGNGGYYNNGYGNGYSNQYGNLDLS